MNPVVLKNQEKLLTVVQCQLGGPVVDGILKVHQPQNVLQKKLLDFKLFLCDFKEKKRHLDKQHSALVATQKLTAASETTQQD